MKYNKLNKLDWKQWIPLYGIYQGIKDAKSDKASFIMDIFNEKIPMRYHLHALLDAIAAIGIYGCLEKLLQ